MKTLSSWQNTLKSLECKEDYDSLDERRWSLWNVNEDIVVLTKDIEVFRNVNEDIVILTKDIEVFEK